MKAMRDDRGGDGSLILKCGRLGCERERQVFHCTKSQKSFSNKVSLDKNSSVVNVINK